MSDKDLIDISDPMVAQLLGEALASDLLREVSPHVMIVSPTSRAAFFQAYLAVMLGGMRASLGDPMAAAVLDEIQRLLEAHAPKAEGAPKIGRAHV